MGDIKVYDFKKSKRFSVDNIRKLTLNCEDFCKMSNLQMVYELKNEDLKLKMGKVNQTNYEAFVEEVNHDSIIIEYKMEPLIDNMAIFLDKYVALVLVDLILGGDGNIYDINRDLTNIDLDMLHYFMDQLLKRCQVPNGCEEAEIESIYSDTAQYRKLKNRDSLFICNVKSILCGKEIGIIRLCIPYRSMELVINDLEYKKKNRFNTNKGEIEDNTHYYEHVKNINIGISAILGSAILSINDLLNINEGDILLLDQNINDDIKINVGGYETYKGKPGLIGIKKGIEIRNVIDEEI